MDQAVAAPLGAAAPEGDRPLGGEAFRFPPLFREEHLDALSPQLPLPLDENDIVLQDDAALESVCNAWAATGYLHRNDVGRLVRICLCLRKQRRRARQFHAYVLQHVGAPLLEVRLGPAPGEHLPALGRGHDHLHGSFRTRNLIVELNQNGLREQEHLLLTDDLDPNVAGHLKPLRRLGRIGAEVRARLDASLRLIAWLPHLQQRIFQDQLLADAELRLRASEDPILALGPKRFDHRLPNDPAGPCCSV